MRTVVLLMLAVCVSTQAQTPNGSIVNFEIENFTIYVFDCPNSELAQSTSKLDRPLGPTFETGLGIGDIVSVNGTPVKGTAYETVIGLLGASPNPAPGAAIVDQRRIGVVRWDLEFLDATGKELGTLYIGGLDAGMPTPAGAPAAMPNGASLIIGGSGAFLGAHGYFSAPNDATMGARFTSACEDPSLRRVFAEGRGKRHGFLYLIPLAPPMIVMTTSGPNVIHMSDGTPVTAANPAHAGETLTLFASGLGPTRPGVDPGQPFTSDPVQVTNSPVQVVVNGNAIDVSNASGVPGAVDSYQVDFALPDNLAPGQVSIQLTSAWIAGPAVTIPVQ
ncbi:MAG TPA: hypothetical protein VEV17_18850 [Bryobacteraceae bacterium]|nr:hypothetical protein [Bryobacteraceae bacterium]